tara:strand:- start:2124 stop:2765 length:642 start_codon:yes stop_codon:yes gene_type:complete
MKTSVRDTYLNFDHSNMDFGILMNAVDEARLLEEGVFVEFGTGMGVAGRLIIPHLSGEWFYTVDPYEPYEGNAVGDIDPWEGVNQNMLKGEDFYLKRKEDTVKSLSKIAETAGCNFIYYDMADYEFIHSSNERFKFVYVDSLHTLNHVQHLCRIMILHNKIVDGGMLVFDDVSCYDHSVVDEFLIKNNYTKEEEGDFKISYRRGLDNAPGFFV